MIKKIYDFYSGDFTSKELENTLFKETPIRYKYYLKEMEKSGRVNTDNEKKPGVFRLLKNFAIAFLTKLTPVIRILYSIAIIAFIFAWVNSNWNLAVLTFIIVNLILIYEIAEKLTAGDELKVARDLQTGLIPNEPPKDKFFDISFFYESAKVVGGDFIDFIKKNDEVYYISTGDISGKGMSAALYMIQVRLLIRQLIDMNDKPCLILKDLNKNIFRHFKRGLYFSSILTEVQNTNLKICRAGHTPVLMYENSTGQCIEIQQKGMAVGLTDGEMFDNSIEEINIEAKKGDVFFFYSDGLTETMNRQKEEFGLDKIKKTLSENFFRSAGDIKNIILKEINDFRGYAEVHDDITLIIMKTK